jgi:drug/metabolite transporter (DMT)-like permease
MALTSVILSYSYVYLNASEATAVKRAWEMFWSILAWFLFFQEKHFIKKILFAICIIIGLIIMVL